MSRMFVGIVLTVSSIQVCLGGEPKSLASLWHIDKDSVFVGGCVTIVVDRPSRETSKLTVRIDDREPVRLVDAAGSAARLKETTLVLISHDLFHPEISRGTDGTTITVRVPPIFAKPGNMRLELEADGISWGVKTVEVIAAPANAKRAIDLLYPAVVRGDESAANAGRLMHLLTTGSFGEGAGTDERAELDKVREVLPELVQHPDWEEVFEMLVGRLDTQYFRRSVTTGTDDPPYRIRDEFDELPSIPASATRCLACNPKSPFVEAIQTNIRDLLSDVHRAEKVRRSEIRR